MSNHDCMFHREGKCRQIIESDGTAASVNLGDCGYTSSVDRILLCSLCTVETMEKASMIEKRAAWADVKAKGEAIVATGGVEIEVDNYAFVRAKVTSAQVADRFPVEKGGPYRTALIKTKFKGTKQTGGWVQSFTCNCTWGKYHDGAPGQGWAGRFCSHALATLITANARARQDFFGDRTASMNYTERGFCTHCGNLGELDVLHNLCEACFEEETFNAMVARIYSQNETERRAAVEFLDGSVPRNVQAALRDEMVIHHYGGIMCVAANGHRAILPVAGQTDTGYNKTATRIFSQAEQEELQNESLGQLARNHDRYEGGATTSLY